MSAMIGTREAADVYLLQGTFTHGQSHRLPAQLPETLTVQHTIDEADGVVFPIKLQHALSSIQIS